MVMLVMPVRLLNSLTSILVWLAGITTAPVCVVASGVVAAGCVAAGVVCVAGAVVAGATLGCVVVAGAVVAGCCAAGCVAGAVVAGCCAAGGVGASLGCVGAKAGAEVAPNRLCHAPPACTVTAQRHSTMVNAICFIIVLLFFFSILLHRYAALI
jgi:hypothetical protein